MAYWAIDKEAMHTWDFHGFNELFNFVCEYEDVCALGVNQCENDGVCVASGDGHFQCHCRQGFAGELCERDCSLGNCSAAEMRHPCAKESICGAGKCRESGSLYECRCDDSGFEGSHCEVDIDECVDTGLCYGHGTCENTHGGYTCVCFQGYTGTNCRFVVSGLSIDDGGCGSVENLTFSLVFVSVALMLGSVVAFVVYRYRLAHPRPVTEQPKPKYTINSPAFQGIFEKITV